ncbi:subtilisin-like protease SBT3.10 isoform X1 [Ziziphus jujuba]|uniref:Subtilisin-like protease SBT3.10 isoform X1 n=1 Tax=Ziziphus jujuba TaxID=326968 RepID=A0A6P3ZGP1_ZIZJJ|nr:subtilisin-like protease SBT3.10 isoform X1 [Ziziphus jujuba]
MNFFPQIRSKARLLLVFLSLFSFVNKHLLSSIAADVKSNQVYIVHMGKRQHDEDIQLLKKTHHQVLATVLGSKEASADAMIYSYKHGFSGFAARLTATQAKTISELSGVVHVIPNQLYKVQTTRSWDYLRLSSHYPTEFVQKSKLGDGVIIGLIDTGIWPESDVFSDEGLGPIPSRWKGVCESGEQFSGEKHCNKKLIGARYFAKALEAEYGQTLPFNTTENPEYLSARDAIGHGTHTSTTAAGSLTTNKSYNGLGVGTVRGGAPQARLAMYKVCWNLDGGVCSGADILKAFDEAIHDGVDVISVSIAADMPPNPEFDAKNGIAVGAFHAVEKGIVVVCSAANTGPSAQTVQNASPWILTVAASTVDRSFPTLIALGNNWTTMGQAMFTGKDTGFVSLVYPEVSDLDYPRDCKGLAANSSAWAVGKVVLCFTSEFSHGPSIDDVAWSLRKTGILALIVAENPSRSLHSCPDNLPCVQVSYEIGMKILAYFRSTSSDAQVRISPTKTHDGRPVSTTLAYFSSRGPNSFSPAVLKPDIAAPGVNILAAVSPSELELKNAFAFMSGTSMATPHVSGIVALLKSLHWDWSPAAIKSAIVTTAWTTDPSGEPIFAEGEPMKLADAFDYGGGIVNFNRAADPGLVYDMGSEDYVKYLCAMGYNNSAISLLREHSTSCPSKTPSVLDINLPSITIPNLRNVTTITRTVKNVGAVDAQYKVVVDPPFGIQVSVQPDILKFNSTTNTISFSVSVFSTHKVTTGYYFGSLTWTDGVHEVRSPMSVRTVVTLSHDG